MVARRELVHVRHRLPVRTAAVVLADEEEHGHAHVVREVDRVAVEHQRGHLVGPPAEQRAIVRLQVRRHVVVRHLVVPDRDARHAAEPQVRMLAQLHQGEVSAPRPAADHRARRVRDAVLHQPREPGVQVLELRPADVAGQRVAPLGAVPGRAAVVDHRHGEPGVDVRLRLRAPPILVQPCGPAVGPDQHRERPVAFRRGVEPVDRLTVLVVEPERDVRTSRRGDRTLGAEHLRRPGRPGCAARWRRSPSGARPRRPAARARPRPARRDGRSA